MEHLETSSRRRHGTRLATPCAALLAIGVVLGIGAPNVGAGPSSTTTITGFVYESDGSTALGDICVSVDTGQPGTSPSVTDSSATDGSYTLTGLTQGLSYRIRFDNFGECGQVASGNWVEQWYNDTPSGTSNFFQANPVAAGSSGVDATMAEGGSIAGYVYKHNGTTALPGICVSVTNTNTLASEQVPDAATGLDGSYSLGNLATGQSYNLQYDNSGGCGHTATGSWVTQYYDNTTSYPGNQQIAVVSPSPSATAAEQSMTPGGAITGQAVSAQTGAALEGICVTARQINNGGGGGGNFGPSPSATTAVSGDYSLNNMTAASYAVEFNNCGGQAGNWVQQYWESAGNQNDATAVGVTASKTTSGIDAAMQPGGSITGTVTGTPVGQSNGPLQGVCVSVDTGQSVSFGSSSQFAAATSSSGRYSLVGLPPGQNYVIRFDNNNDCNYFGPGNGGSWVTQWYNATATGSSSFGAAPPVSVPSTTPVTLVTQKMTAGGTIAGEAQMDSSGQGGICVSIDPGLPSGLVPETTVTRGDGSYMLSNVPAGSWDVRFDGYSCSSNGGNNVSDSWVTQWYDNTADGASSFSGATTVLVNAGEMTASVDALNLVNGAGSMSGQVSPAAGGGQSNGQSLGGICVDAFNTSGTEIASSQSTSFSYVSNNSNYNYSVYGLASGTYLVRFESCLGTVGTWVTQWYNDSSRSKGAEDVSVTAGNNTGDVGASMVAVEETSVGPDSGSTAGGTLVTISGSGFTGATSVTFGGVKGKNPSGGSKPKVISDSLLQIMAPKHAAGTVPIIVVTPSGPCPSANAVSFTYIKAS